MDVNKIRPGMLVVGSDDYTVGEVAGVEGRRINLAPVEGGPQISRNHFMDIGLVATIAGGMVRLSAQGNPNFTPQAHCSGEPTDR